VPNSLSIPRFSDLLPLLINSKVRVDDLIDVAETFVQLLKKIKRLQQNASGQPDSADDESLYYFTCYPKADDYRCQPDFCAEDDDVKKVSPQTELQATI